MNVGIWGWDTPNAAWVKVLVDSLGHLQVDMLTAPTTDVHLYAWGTDAWTWLLTESDTLRNLRVRLYAGADEIYAHVPTPSRYSSVGKYGLQTIAVPHLAGVTNYLYPWRSAYAMTDDVTGGHFPTIGLMGFNGVKWDRIRSDGLGVLKVSKGDIQPTRIRMTATGRVGVAGAKTLFWVACSPDDPGAEWEIADADAGGGAVVYDHFDQDRSSEQIDFNPPMEFATGIWVEKFDHMRSLVFCYI